MVHEQDRTGLNGAFPKVSSGAPESSAPPVDAVLGFTIAARDVRGRVARLGPLLDQILSAHDYPMHQAHILAEALGLMTLVGSTLCAQGGQATLQVQGQGRCVDLLVVDYRQGELRGYVRGDGDAQDVSDPCLPGLFGEGYLALTIDRDQDAQRYQSIVPLEGKSLVDAVRHYFTSSEQIPTFLQIAVNHTPKGWRAGGLLVQHLPASAEDSGTKDSGTGESGAPDTQTHDTETSEENWRHITILAETLSSAELLDDGLPLEDLVWRLFSENEIRVFPAALLSRGCRCSPDRLAGILRKMPPADLAHMMDEDGLIGMDCAFCARHFQLSPPSAV